MASKKGTSPKQATRVTPGRGGFMVQITVNGKKFVKHFTRQHGTKEWIDVITQAESFAQKVQQVRNDIMLAAEKELQEKLKELYG
jgi:hypothetical protein